MDYENFLPNYPDYNDSFFQQKLFNKKEFFDYKLHKKVEEIKEGEALYSQLIVSRLMSQFTLYDELLLYHAVGSGKTGVAFGITENLYNSGKFFRAYIFAKGEDLLRQQKRQLVYMYSKRYKDKVNKEEIKQENEERVLNRLVSDFYAFRTIETFAKEIENAPDEYIMKEYSNCIFVIDEIHNIVEQSEEETKFYKQFFRLFHLVQNRKILLMSGTPMRNEVQEIAELMNLILPLDSQMLIKEEFVQRYISNENLRNEKELKTFFRGRISYLRESVENIDTKYMGVSVSEPKIDQFKVYMTNMDSFQSKTYEKVYMEETSGRNVSFFANSRQSSLFVFPNGTFGNEGLSMFTNKKGNLVPNFIEQVNTIDKLNRFSSKYASIIKDILNNRNKKVYIYCSVVNGSGCNLFAKILELYGFEQVKSANVPLKAKRYILLTSETQNIQKNLSVYNAKRNKYGEYCQVVIGSRKISEGFNFKDVQIIHVATLHWNYTETQQAIARGIRLRSHNNLIEDGVIPQIKIYQHVSIPKDRKVDSIDLHMLHVSRGKDILMKKMERIIEESAIDCPLFYERNVRETGEGSRDCNYQQCEYKCDTSSLIPPLELDLSTYNLYYQNEENILNFLREIFKIEFSIHLDSIQDKVQVDRFELVKTLNTLILSNTPIINKYDVECFLREHNNRYYLVDNIIFPGNHLELGLYTEQPFFVQKKSLKEIVKEKSFSVTINIINRIRDSKSREEVKKELDHLIIDHQELFLEKALSLNLAKKENKLSTWIIDIYKDHIKYNNIGEYLVVSTLLKPKMRCLNKSNKWIDCLNPVILENKEDIEVFETNKYGYIGIIDGDNFCIKDLRNPEEETEKTKTDKRQKKTGAKCLEAGWNKDKLALLCIHLEIPISDPENIPTNAREKIMKKASLIKILETTWYGLSNDDISKALYWYEQTKQDTCRIIKEWFNEKGLLIKGPCGKTGKIKN